MSMSKVFMGSLPYRLGTEVGLGVCEQKSVRASVGGGESGYRLHYLPCDGILGRRRSGNLSVLTI